jgi:hypothetical protein
LSGELLPMAVLLPDGPTTTACRSVQQAGWWWRASPEPAWPELAGLPPPAWPEQ